MRMLKRTNSSQNFRTSENCCRGKRKTAGRLRTREAALVPIGTLAGGVSLGPEYCWSHHVSLRTQLSDGTPRLRPAPKPGSGAHTHAAPDDTYIERRWGTTFINVAGLTRYMGSCRIACPEAGC